MSSITKKEARGLDEVYEVRAGIRHIGIYEDLEEAEQMAEFYDAEVFDWTTGDRLQARVMMDNGMGGAVRQQSK